MTCIYKALLIYFGEEWAHRWVTLGNRGSMFAGTVLIEYMIRQGQPGMIEVRRMLGCSGVADVDNRLQVRSFHWESSHRLIPSRYSEGGTVLSAIAENATETEEPGFCRGWCNKRSCSERPARIHRNQHFQSRRTHFPTHTL